MSSPSKQRPVVFYRAKHGVYVTGDVLYAHGREYNIRDIDDAHWGMGSPQTKRTTALVAIGAEALVAAAAGGIAITSYGVLWVLLATIVHLPLTAGAVWIAVLRSPTPRQLWAVYDGETTLLYHSTDVTEFHKVARAVQRAVEYNREPSR